jgi:hypothetical protein
MTEPSASPPESKQAAFSKDGPPVIKTSHLSIPGNPSSAIERIRDSSGFELKVVRSTQVPSPSNPRLSSFTIEGRCDPFIAVQDLATLLEARFSGGASVLLSETGKRLVSQLLAEVESEKQAARIKTREAINAIQEVAAIKASIEDQTKVAQARLDELDRLAQERSEQMQQEEIEHAARLARLELPQDFNPNRFPEAEVIANETLERWQETLGDPTHLVSGDYTELLTILTKALQRLASKVADHYAQPVEL